MPEQVRTVLITGANGFIGSRVCRLLAASGYTLRIICRPTSDLSFLEKILYERCIADITRPETLPAAIKGVDYVVHLAGLVRAKRSEDYFRVNQEGTFNLLNAVKNHNPGITKFVLVSSTAASGPSDDRPRRETDPPRPLTTYGRSKLAGEEAAHRYFSLLPITILRPPGVYGPGDKAIFTLFDLVNRGFRPYMAGGYNRVQMVYVDDLARAVRAAMESSGGIGQTYFIAEPKAYSVRELLDTIGGLLHRKGLGISIPLWLVNLLAELSAFGYRLVGRTPRFSREKAREMTANWEMDVSRAREDLGFETEVDFITGAGLTIAWYREKGWLR